MGNYNKTYGALGAIIILLLWFYFMAYAVLFGAAMNAELERQTVRDTTAGTDRPMGERRAARRASRVCTNRARRCIRLAPDQDSTATVEGDEY